MLRQIHINKLQEIPENGDVYLFRSCTINSLYPSVEAATRKNLKLLGYNILESSEQSCCTDPLYYSNLEDDFQMTAIMARNLSIIGKLTKNIVVECNGCFTTILNAIKNLHNDEIKNKIEPILSKFNYELYYDFNVIHVVELYYKILSKILDLQKVDLNGIKIAVHYGCNYLGSHPDSILTDPQAPILLETIIKECGGIVAEYSEKLCCCGAGIIQRHINPDLALDVSFQKMKSISEVDAELIVTICPFCMSTLENCQFSLDVEKDFEINIPVIHVSELISVVLGIDPVNDLFLNHRAIDPIPILEKTRKL